MRARCAPGVQIRERLPGEDGRVRQRGADQIGQRPDVDVQDVPQMVTNRYPVVAVSEPELMVSERFDGVADEPKKRVRSRTNART